MSYIRDCFVASLLAMTEDWIPACVGMTREEGFLPAGRQGFATLAMTVKTEK
jgi:hypothetical protein